MVKFDVHAHAFMPPEGQAAHAAAQALMKVEGFAGRLPDSDWSEAAALAFMDERDIAMQLLSLPGSLDAEQARKWNTRAAAIVAAHPDRFGLLAALPMRQPDLAVEEIRFAVEELDTDGFAVATNYEGAYFGNPSFDPVFSELDRRRSPLFIHPALPAGFEQLGLGRPGPLIEYPMDTARTVVDAVFAGVLLRYPSLVFILAHAGGVLPTLQDRIALLGVEPWVANPLRLTAEQIRQQLASIYLDTAIAGGVASIAPAVEMVGIQHMVFGTDYPPAGTTAIDSTLIVLAATMQNDEAELERAFARLFPKAVARARTGPLTPTP